MSVVVFDFDGVLFDTARECLEVAFRTVRSLPWAARWRHSTVIPSDDAELFLRYRGWVGPPWQYAVLFRCIAERTFPASTAEFQTLAATHEAELAGFTATYFATRHELSRDRTAWASLCSPYEEATRVFVDLHRRGLARVLSTRDDVSIRMLADFYLDIEPVQLPRAGSRKKWEILVDLAEPRLLFLDDHLAHALPAFRHGIATRLALWGYASPDDADVALTAGLPCLQLTELARAVAAHLESS
jgi:phosphoglycolate phosphatase-like HAD superfamily hydrolase